MRGGGLVVSMASWGPPLARLSFCDLRIIVSIRPGTPTRGSAKVGSPEQRPEQRKPMPAEAALSNDAPLLLHSASDGIARLTLNRPRQYNALSSALMSALQQALDGIAADKTVRVVVIEGAGRGFCAGHDLKELRAHPGDRDFFQAIFKQCSRLMTTITALPQPVIAKVHGIATAAGCQLVATCDLAVADRSAQFGTPGVNIGLFCSTPMVALSRAVPRKQAMEMLLTGDMIEAAEALRLGLVNRAVPGEALEAETLDLGRKSTRLDSSH